MCRTLHFLKNELFIIELILKLRLLGQIRKCNGKELNLRYLPYIFLSIGNGSFSGKIFENCVKR